LLSAVRAPDLSGPVVVGGSIIVRGMLAAPPSLQAELVPLLGDDVIPVSDGMVGAAVLVLRHAGREVDEALFHTIRAEVARVSR
jgi:glucosamine kinase